MRWFDRGRKVRKTGQRLRFGAPDVNEERAKRSFIVIIAAATYVCNEICARRNVIETVMRIIATRQLN